MRQAGRIYCPLKPLRYASHTTPRLSNTFLLSLSFVARDRNTWEGYKFNFIPRLNIISADIYGKYHAIVCCVTIKHRFIILSYSILDICCSNNIAGRYFFQTVLSTEISPTVNNYRYQWSKINSLKKERRRKNKWILNIHAYTYITRRRRQRRWLKEEALSFRIHLPKWILVLIYFHLSWIFALPLEIRRTFHRSNRPLTPIIHVEYLF